MGKAKVVVIPALPHPYAHVRTLPSDPRYVEGQRLLVEAIHYLLNTDRKGNYAAAELLLEHVRTRFRMSDRAQGEIGKS